MFIGSVETVVGDGNHLQEYIAIPPLVIEDESPHVPALFIGPDFDAAAAAEVEALCCRHIVALDVPHEGLQPSERRVLLSDALGALFLENPFDVLTSVALGLDGAADVYQQIEEVGPLREFDYYVLPLSTQRRLDVPPAARASLVVDYVEDMRAGGTPKTPLQYYAAVGTALQGHDRKRYPNFYRLPRAIKN